MQGSYNNKGLPRPYYMKPSSKISPYYKHTNNFFNTRGRKLTGYILLLILFGTCMFWISQDVRPSQERTYEIVTEDDLGAAGSIHNADKEIENSNLAGNLAQGSNGKVGKGVVEAPKGGTANEAPLAKINDEVAAEKKDTKLHNININRVDE